MTAKTRIPLVLLALIAAALAATSCKQLSDNLPEAVQQPGPIVAPTETPVPSQTPVPSPTPSPTPMPIVVVQQGERDLRNGDWDAAAAAFQQVLADPGATAEQRATADLGLAQAALKQGDFETARSALDSFLAESPDHPRVPQAQFLRGDAYMGLGDWQAAATDYRAYLAEKPGVIDSHVHERIADAQLADGQVAAALAAYDEAIAAERYPVGALALREKVAAVHRSLGSTAGAVAQYRAILEQAENPAYRASIEFALGQTWLEAGEADAAYDQFQQVFMTYPESFEALSALRALLEAEMPVDAYQRGLVNYNQGQYDIAVQSFLSHIAALQSVRADEPQTHLYIARAYRALGNTQAALSELQGTITRFGGEGGDAWAQAWLDMADIQASELGDAEAAFSTYDTFVEENGALPQAADALAAAAALAGAEGDAERAITYYRQLATDFPADPRAAAGLFDAALALYDAGQTVDAQSLLEETIQLSANDNPARSYLWLGKTLLAEGDTTSATAALNTAVNSAPRGYYGLRAADLLAGEEPFTPPQAFALPEDPDEGRAEAEQWLVETFTLDVQPPLAESLRGDITGDPRLVRGNELWQLDIIPAARQNFDDLINAYWDDPLALYQLSIYLREIGFYRGSILAVARLQTLADVAPLDAPAFLTRLRYPTYFSDLVLRYSEQYNLDPLLVFALIRQESLFEGFATSTASAQGLMQIWPPTGEDIAAQIGWPNYSVTDLQRPFVSVAFGTWLLREEYDRLNGDPYAVLTAYNAGPGRALAWQEESGGDPDRYLEAISLAEPKLYVQRIVEHYEVYRALYATP